MKDIKQKIRKVLFLYKEIDKKVDMFTRKSKLKCLSGCGKCCESPNVEATVLEMIPLALDLWEKDQAEEWWEKTKKIDGKGPCVFCRPDPLIPGKGRCGVYPFRPMLCRFYAFSARKEKDNRLSLYGCPLIRDAQPEEFKNAQKGINAGMKVPCMSDYTIQVSAMDPQLGKEQLPINKAAQLAIEKVGMWRKYA